MQFAKRLFMGLGAVALMAVLLTLAAPKAVRGVVATLVQVANTTANPIPNRDVDEPGHATLVVLACSSITEQGSGFQGVLPFYCYLQDASQCCVGPFYSVPAGYRLEIQQLDANCLTPKNQSITQVGLQVTTSGWPTPHWLPLVNQGTGEDSTVLENNLAVHYYADPGSSLQFQGFQTDFTRNTGCLFTVSGYLISYP